MDAGGISQGVKEYPSHYASLEQRKALVERLLQLIDNPVITGATVRRIDQTASGYVIDIKREIPFSSSQQQASALVLGTGRLGGIAFHEGQIMSRIPLRLLRFEVGIRVESHYSVGFLSKIKLPDVKRLWENKSAQIRTFCTCRNGEIWNIPYFGLSAISGRSDGPPTEFSNFGFLARLHGNDLELGYKLWKHLRTHSLKNGSVIYESIESFLGEPSLHAKDEAADLSSRPWFPREEFEAGSIQEHMGQGLHEIIARAVRDLLTWSPDLIDPRTMCLWPAIEGVGFYPEIDGDLRVRGHSIWCAGDVVGQFRGLIPSLVSGYYAGLSIANSYHL
jgi:hypothetical protein